MKTNHEHRTKCPACKRSVRIVQGERPGLWLIAGHFMPRTKGLCRGWGTPVLPPPAAIDDQPLTSNVGGLRDRVA